VKADGVHLGKNDMPIEEARKLLGEGFIIGGTANTLNVKRHYEAGADY
jgi:thiamine-phosphate pyrophosphorylase